MAKKRSKKVTEAGFIPGIYNYCDRWCERCEQKSRCMSFVMGKKIEEKGGLAPARNLGREEENVWARLKEVFESTYEVLRELAEERGIEVEDIYTSENINKEFWGEDYENRFKEDQYIQLVEVSDIIRTCVIYESLADQCLERIYETLEEKGREDTVPGEALEIINWYLDLIQAKTRRALHGYFREAEAEEYNGSAKVVLLAVDRSLKAWAEIESCSDHFRREAGHLIVVLEQIRADMEKQFPEARQFQRPGLDNLIFKGDE